jgi:TolB protein
MMAENCHMRFGMHRLQSNRTPQAKQKEEARISRKSARRRRGAREAPRTVNETGDTEKTMKTIFEKTKVGRAMALGLTLAVLLVLAALADPAEAKKGKGDENAGRVVFASDRTTGQGVNNPDGDFEIFVMNPDGKKLEQLTENAADDFDATLSPNGQEIAFVSQNIQPSNPEGDSEIYLMNADGSDPRNLTDNGGVVNERDPRFSPDGQEVAFTSFGKQTSNPEGDFEVYLMNTDGTDKRNLSNNANLAEFASDFAPGGQKLAYSSFGIQPSNPEGDFEVYLMNRDGSEARNLTDTAGAISDFDAAVSPDGQKIAFVSAGVRPSNPEGDDEIYAMNADGSDQKNLTNTADGIQDDFPDFSPGGTKIAYDSDGSQSSNREGDDEVYLMNALDGSRQKNVTNNGSGVNDVQPDFASAKR